MSSPPHVLVTARISDATDGDILSIPASTSHHLRRVLRLADGAALSITDGCGAVADGVLIGDRVALVGAVRRTPEPSPRLVLGQALSKGRRAEDAVRVACELGVDRIVPVVAARTQGRPDARGMDALIDRWRAVAVAALEQSRGTALAVIEPPADGVLAIGGGGADVLRLLAVPGERDLPSALVDVGTPDEVIVAIGPEGGWTPEEVAAATTSGWLPVGLGPTVLRTEHAGPVAVAVIAALLGRWKRSVPLGDRDGRADTATREEPGSGGLGATLP